MSVQEQLRLTRDANYRYWNVSSADYNDVVVIGVHFSGICFIWSLWSGFIWWSAQDDFLRNLSMWLSWYALFGIGFISVLNHCMNLTPVDLAFSELFVIAHWWLMIVLWILSFLPWFLCRGDSGCKELKVLMRRPLHWGGSCYKQIMKKRIAKHQGADNILLMLMRFMWPRPKVLQHLCLNGWVIATSYTTCMRGMKLAERSGSNGRRPRWLLILNTTKWWSCRWQEGTLERDPVFYQRFDDLHRSNRYSNPCSRTSWGGSILGVVCVWEICPMMIPIGTAQIAIVWCVACAGDTQYWTVIAQFATILASGKNSMLAAQALIEPITRTSATR